MDFAIEEVPKASDPQEILLPLRKNHHHRDPHKDRPIHNLHDPPLISEEDALFLQDSEAAPSDQHYLKKE